MKTHRKKSFLESIPSWVLALFVLITAAIVMIITDLIWTPNSETGLKSHLINDLIIATGCFVIVRKNPKSIWYVLLICNASMILSSILEPGFWQSRMLFPIGAGWALSFIVSLIAMILAKKNQIQTNQVN